MPEPPDPRTVAAVTERFQPPLPEVLSTTQRIGGTKIHTLRAQEELVSSFSSRISMSSHRDECKEQGYSARRLPREDLE